ncbi:MAG: SAM-dependent methyltransferase, partial [Actinomycetota bacterium]|nr:SAM-dependent methyltransferase [Actinomycetota bacterium]
MPNNEFGDFQTPVGLATRIASLLGAGGFRRVLEPTCGRGGFLEAVRGPDQERIGIEVQDGHAREAARFGTILRRNVFTLDLGEDLRWTTSGRLLVVGNPPWVTSADLSRFGSANIPAKSNLKGLTGLEARTGSANFDVAEYIWLKLIRELAPQHPTIALLCKTQVARNVLAYCAANELPVDGGRLHRVDSMRWFGAAVDAGLFVLHVRPGARDYTCEIHDSLESGP